MAIKASIESSLRAAQPQPGSVCQQWVRRNGKVFGPYFYRFHRVGGTLVKVYIRPGELDAALAGCALHRARRKSRAILNRMARDCSTRVTAMRKEANRLRSEAFGCRGGQR